MRKIIILILSLCSVSNLQANNIYDDIDIDSAKYLRIINLSNSLASTFILEHQVRKNAVVDARLIFSGQKEINDSRNLEKTSLSTQLVTLYLLDIADANLRLSEEELAISIFTATETIRQVVLAIFLTIGEIEFGSID